MRLYAVLTAICLSILFLSPKEQAPAIGGSPEKLKEEIQMLTKKEEILRAQFEALNKEEEDIAREKKAVRSALVIAEKKRDYTHRDALERRLDELSHIERGILESRQNLLALKKNKKKYEAFLVESLRQNYAIRPSPSKTLSVVDGSPNKYALLWPVLPLEGVSAGFDDSSYEKRFGMVHEAIDIPVDQGSTVRAVADGKVAEINDNGYGYNTVVLEHEDGLVTIYGHVSKFVVTEGDRVFAGDVIAKSGGRPGSKGAGSLTTGPHVHFETRIFGEAIDPLYYLPPVEVAIAGSLSARGGSSSKRSKAY